MAPPRAAQRFADLEDETNMKDISLIRLLPEKTNVQFFAVRKIAEVLSILAIIGSIFLFMTKGLNYGIDFTGGTVIEIDTGSDPQPLVLVYIWFRFEWQFGAGAVAALFHDVILTIGVFSLTQIEFNLSIIAAILTIVGYSLNDTVIVYDRIRENLRKYKSMPLPELLNLSVNDTLSRTIMTSMTTLLALVALYVLGGEGLRGFSFAMIWGIAVGTYSSIFVASPLLMILKLKRGNKIEGELSKEVKA